ncbi:transglycosylase SLT domain-containing protein [Isoptericola rhizosphaerae]|uniref:transglycosylase SLT domain-containing protein n=1 Tax=Isoptericola rhizosphaerae TaxID=3377837 RepID=UPI00383ACF47
MKAALGACGAGLVAVALLLGLLLFGDEDEAKAEPSGGSGKLDAKNVPAEYRDAIAAAAERCEAVTAPLLAAQIDAESNWEPAAISPVGAQGLAQFMPATWQAWGSDYSDDGVADPFDPEDAIGSQADYMCHLDGLVSDLLDGGHVDGDALQLTLAAYNAGLGRVQAAGGIPAIAETRGYVKKILASIAQYSKNDAAGDYTTGGGPPLSDDGTYREAIGGSGRLDPSNLCAIPWAGHQVLRCDAAEALEDLNAKYRERFGTDLAITDSYRDYASQVVLKAQKPTLAATPGYSNHGWGLALDIGNLGPEGSPRHAWLRENGPRYGWQHPSWARLGGRKPEAWHWEYVGT